MNNSNEYKNFLNNENNSKRKFHAFMCRHVFNRIKIQIYDYEGDETYSLDMPPDVYKELKKIIKKFDEEEHEILDIEDIL